MEIVQTTAYGLGAVQSPPDERDFPIAELFASVGLAAAAILPASWTVPHEAPVLNQHNTPMCVAFSTSQAKSTQDGVGQKHFINFDEPTFFRQIGGGPNGAIVRNALDRMLKVGYPPVSGSAGDHKIKAYYAVPKTEAAIKAALYHFGELILATPWYNSWFNPVGHTAVLPAPDYSVGGHAIVAKGWSPAGLVLRNSWGSRWGASGNCTMPWSYVLHSVWEFWKTVDA